MEGASTGPVNAFAGRVRDPLAARRGNRNGRPGIALRLASQQSIRCGQGTNMTNNALIRLAQACFFLTLRCHFANIRICWDQTDTYMARE